VPGIAPTDDPTVADVGTFRGFIQPVSGGEASRFAKLDELVTHRLYCPVSVALEYGDVVTQGEYTGVVVFSNQAEGIAGVDHHKEILLSSV
jgi:hypothetical protein